MASHVAYGSQSFPTTSMASIYGHEGRFLDDFRALDPGRRLVARRALRWIEASPRPDGIAKREASAYPGTGLVIAIVILGGHLLSGCLAITWSLILL